MTMETADPSPQIEPQRSSRWLLAERIFFALGLIYLLSPTRNIFGDVFLFGLATLAVFFLSDKLGLSSREVQSSRVATGLLLGFTISTGLLIWGYGLFFLGQSYNLSHVFVTLLVYLPFAWLQQVAMQKYVVSRHCESLGSYLGAKSGAASITLWTVIVAAVLFGLCHLPLPGLVWPTGLAGLVWTYYYLKTGRLGAIAVSHAFLATSLFYVCLRRDPFRDLGLFVG
jgi:membrane protease YdiL (CAAX protease family)